MVNDQVAAPARNDSAAIVLFASVAALVLGLAAAGAVGIVGALGNDWEPVAVVFCLVFVGVLVTHLGGALAYDRGEVTAGRIALWVSTLPLTFMAVITGFSIGFLLLPAVLLAWVSVIAAMGRR